MSNALRGGGSPRLLSRTCLPAHSRPGTPGRRQQVTPLRGESMRFAKLVPTLFVVGLVVMACGGGGGATASPATIPSSLSVSSFDVSFSAMATLKDLHGAGSGLVGVLMPDTTSSTRWVNSDLPYLTKAFQMAGYSSSEFKIDNAQGNDQTQIAQ